jgi:hypothetical protein
MTQISDARGQGIRRNKRAQRSGGFNSLRLAKGPSLTLAAETAGAKVVVALGLLPGNA